MWEAGRNPHKCFRRMAHDQRPRLNAASGMTPVEDILYVHPARGADANAGSKEQPLRSLGEAVRRVNRSTADGPVTIVLSEGIHAFGEAILLRPERRTWALAWQAVV